MESFTSLNIVNGEDRMPPTQFVPPFSKSWSLNLVKDVLYTAISQGCNGSKSAVYVFNGYERSEARLLRFSKLILAAAASGGRAGIVSSGLMGLSTLKLVMVHLYEPRCRKIRRCVPSLYPQRILKLKDHYTAGQLAMAALIARIWISDAWSPTVFHYKTWDLVVGGGKEGRLVLLDAKSLGGKTNDKPSFPEARFIFME